MNRAYHVGLVLLVLLIGCTGCFDLETEVRFLEDGSGFVTQWVRMDEADLMAAAALNHTTVAAWSAEVLAGLEASFAEVEGVRLLDRDVRNEAGRITLYYRFVFDATEALNAFLSDPALAEQYILPARGRFDFRAMPASCGGAYEMSFAFIPRDEQTLSRFDSAEIDGLEDREKEAVVKKFFSGSMLLRIVLPGTARVHNAPGTDGRGHPVYRSTVLDFFRKGQQGAVRSKVQCKDGVPDLLAPPDAVAEPITMGYVPTSDEIARVAAAAGNFADILYEYDCDKKGRVTIAATFLVAAPLQGPFEFFFPLLFNAFPRMETDYKVAIDQVESKIFRYRFALKKPIKMSQLKSHYLFFGKEKGIYIFRTNLPQMKFAGPPAVATAATTLVRVRATLPAPIRVSNATEVRGETAIWVLTDRMLRENRITLEALTE